MALTGLATASGPESRLRQSGWSQPARLRYLPPAQPRLEWLRLLRPLVPVAAGDVLPVVRAGGCHPPGAVW